MFFELVSILFAIVPDYGNEFMTKENKNWTSFQNFAPKLNLNHNIYFYIQRYASSQWSNARFRLTKRSRMSPQPQILATVMTHRIFAILANTNSGVAENILANFVILSAWLEPTFLVFP